MDNRDSMASAELVSAELSSAGPAEGTQQQHVFSMSMSGSGAGSEAGKKKRGRPRKYAADGSLAKPLNPVPISASAPSMAGSEYRPVAAIAAGMSAGNSGVKRGRGQVVEWGGKEKQSVEVEGLGEMVAYSAGANFTPHIINVAAGEDVTMKIMSFSQQGSQAICILSANGSISNVTLRQSDSFGGTLTYEGRFEILSLSGSFILNESGGTKSRSGGMSVSLASPDGRVVGGGVAGLLIAASPVQVVVGTFMPSYQMEQMSKRPSQETVISFQTTTVPTSTSEKVYGVGGQGPSISHNPVNASSFKSETWFSSPTDSRSNLDDINVSLPMG